MPWIIKIILLGLGVARLIEWIKEIFTHPIWHPQIKNGPGRELKMLMNIVFSVLAMVIWGPANWKEKVIFFAGVSATATTAHSIWSTLWQVRMAYRIANRDVASRAERRHR